MKFISKSVFIMNSNLNDSKSILVPNSDFDDSDKKDKEQDQLIEDKSKE
jgi:hypothetical protein